MRPMFVFYPGPPEAGKPSGYEVKAPLGLAVSPWEPLQGMHFVARLLQRRAGFAKVTRFISKSS